MPPPPLFSSTQSQGALAGRLRSFSMQDLRCTADETPLHYRDPLYMGGEEEERSRGAPGEWGGERGGHPIELWVWRGGTPYNYSYGGYNWGHPIELCALEGRGAGTL